MRFGQGAAKHREILTEHKDEPAVDRAVAGHDPVTRDLLLGHAEILAAVLDKHVPFLEGTRVEQDIEALARCQLAALMLRLDAAGAAAGAGRLALFIQAPQDIAHEPQPFLTVIPAQAGIQGQRLVFRPGRPVFAGVTRRDPAGKMRRRFSEERTRWRRASFTRRGWGSGGY